MKPADLAGNVAGLLPDDFDSKSTQTKRSWLRAVSEGFSSPYQRRVALGNQRGESAAQAVGKRTGGLSASELRRLPLQKLRDLFPSANRVRTASVNAVARMRREGVSLQEAAEGEGVKPAAVRKWVGEALEKRDGHWQALPADRIAAAMTILSGGEVIEVTVRGSRKRSVVGQHWNAVRQYLDTGNEALLTPFRGLMVAGYELETDPDVLNAMAVRGLFDSGPEGLQIYSNNT